ncbi:MAG: hypothetical protein IPI49_00535 [Myxococcales bacterium]|nr:hypothetical protein [Myxococcales bacterium]
MRSAAGAGRAGASGFVLVVALSACQTEHTVKLQLGGDAGSISQGFLCRTETALPDLAAGDLLFERGHQLATGEVSFSLVVDVVSLGKVLPGCLPEEILSVCRAGDRCPISARACTPMTVAGPRGKRLVAMSEVERLAFVSSFAAELRALPPLFRDAPDGPVVVRAVVSTQPCEQLTDAPRSPFATDGLMGCAYSCPVVLDELDAALRLGFATSEDTCAPEVKACAEYPAVGR